MSGGICWGGNLSGVGNVLGSGNYRRVKCPRGANSPVRENLRGHCLVECLGHVQGGIVWWKCPGRRPGECTDPYAGLQVSTRSDYDLYHSG